MKKLQNMSKLPTLILWICMAVTVGIFGLFYYASIKNQNNENTGDVNFLLYWLYLILIAGISVTISFSLTRFFSRWKEKPRSVIKPFITIVLLFFLFISAYLFSSTETLPVKVSNENENSSFWLRLTDIWLYSIYILLGLIAISILLDVIFSCIKKR
jgi:membrane protease YdiL (CAAX protease family)